MKVPSSLVQIEGRQYAYISLSSKKELSLFIKGIATYGEGEAPCSGGLISENCIVHYGGVMYFAVSYRGDVEAWLNKIESFARDNNLVLADIDGVTITTKLNTAQLSDCLIERW